jgi:two-component system chemotaxis response regulator CheB
MIRVLVAEDSAVTREYLVHLLEQDPTLRVVGTARDGMDAVEQAEQLRPDIILMDVYMPRLNGFEATRLIMERVPTPIVIVSASFSRDEEALTFEALRAGALTVVGKPLGPDQPGQAESEEKIVEAVRLMAEVKVVRRWPRRPRPLAPAGPIAPPERAVRIVAIGASTGGPAALFEILEGLPGDLPFPVLVVQHIAHGFTEGLVEWFAQGTRLAVKLARADEAAVPGTVFVAPERFQMGITKAGRIRLGQDPAEDGFCPSAGYMFETVAEAYGASAIGILLTGMGRDGAKGLLRLREMGAVTIAQDEESSVVFGMPGEAIRIGAARHVLSPDRIAEMVLSLAKAARRGSP